MTATEIPAMRIDTAEAALSAHTWEDASPPPEIAAGVEILVVDDERTLREGCTAMLRSCGYAVTSVGRSDDALTIVRERRFDIVLLDLGVRPVGGMEILRAALDHHPDTVAIVMTERPTLSSAAEALRAGAWNYLPKPFTSAHLEILLGRAVQSLLSPRPESPVAPVFEQVAPHEGDVLIGNSPALRNIIDIASRVARTDAPVVIYGEAGTGKELLARFIHLRSRRSRRTFLPVQCGALYDTQHLGTEGAEEGLADMLAASRGGTLCLVGIPSLALPAQSRLARLLQGGGADLSRRDPRVPALDVRLISILDQHPEDAVRAGNLRSDLLQRLCAVPIEIPPLRDRRGDIPLLARHYLDYFWRLLCRGEAAPILREDTLEWMRSLDWPGNVRQLKQTIQLAASRAEPGSELRREDILSAEWEHLRGRAHPGFISAIIDDEYGVAKEKVLTFFEREYLQRLLDRAHGNISRAARLASVDRTTLYRLMEKHGLRQEQEY